MADDTIQLALTKAEHRTLRLWVGGLASGKEVWLNKDSPAVAEAAAIWLKLRANAILEEPVARPRKGLAERDTDKQVKDVAWAILQSLHEDGSVMSWSDVSQKQEARLYDAARAAIREFQR